MAWIWLIILLFLTPRLIAWPTATAPIVTAGRGSWAPWSKDCSCGISHTTWCSCSWTIYTIYQIIPGACSRGHLTGGHFGCIFHPDLNIFAGVLVIVMAKKVQHKESTCSFQWGYHSNKMLVDWNTKLFHQCKNLWANVSYLLMKHL